MKTAIVESRLPLPLLRRGKVRELYAVDGDTLLVVASDRESARLESPIFSPATKAETGHDQNVTFGHVAAALGHLLAERLKRASLAVYSAGRAYAAERGIIIADTKFEFGTAPDGTLLLIDEVLTPDSSRFWPADGYTPGKGQPSYDKQPLRDYLAGLKQRGQWNGNPPPPPLPADVVAATSARYPRAYRPLPRAPLGMARWRLR